MQESIVFVVRVQCRRKESSRSLSHLLMSFLLQRTLTENVTSEVVENLIKQSIFKTIALETLGGSNADLDNFPNLMVFFVQRYISGENFCEDPISIPRRCEPNYGK